MFGALTAARAAAIAAVTCATVAAVLLRRGETRDTVEGATNVG